MPSQPKRLLRPCERCGVGFEAVRWGTARKWTRFCSIRCAHNITRGPNKGSVAYEAMYYLYHVYPSGLTSRDLAILLNRKPKSVSHYLYTHTRSNPPVMRAGAEDAPNAPMQLRYWLTEHGYNIAHKQLGVGIVHTFGD